MNLLDLMNSTHGDFGQIYIIAEAGINHNGSPEIARNMIIEAAATGVDAVKFQKREISLVYTDDFLNQPRESIWGKTQRDQKNGLELKLTTYEELSTLCRELGLDFSASAWDLNSLELIEELNPAFHKIASAMITNVNFISRVADFKRPTFISTGMSNYSDVEKAIDIFNMKKCPFMLMHTISVYPSPLESLNLRVINTLAERYSVPVGYSGHEASVSPSLTAAALGARAIERHFTLDRSMYGSDQSASLEPDGLRRLVAGLRKIPIILGDGQKKYDSAEKEVAKKLRYWE